MKYLLIKLVEVYRKYISPLKAHASCRFIPTCSEYAIEALKVHGAIKGTALTFWRILRCNPLCKGGDDPVPPRKTEGETNGKGI